MLRRIAPLFLAGLFGCPESTTQDADAGTRDAAADAGRADAGPRDAGSDAGQRIITVHVAYTATAERPLLSELYLTQSSTAVRKITPPLAGGEEVDSKGGPRISGVSQFAWTRRGDALIYRAQQDTFELDEIYLAQARGAPRIERLSPGSPGSGASDFTLAPGADWISFVAVPAGDSVRFAVRTSTGSVPFPFSQSGGFFDRWSPVAAQVLFQDIIGPNRDFWFANFEVDPPQIERINIGGNFGGSGFPEWAPDGSEFAYAGDEVVNRRFELFRVRVGKDGLGARERVHPPFSSGSIEFFDGIGYSPNGTRLAYLADPITARVNDLFVVDPAGTLPATPVQLSPSFPKGATGVRRFSFSPNGRELAYLADHERAGVNGLYLSDGAGKVERIDSGMGAVEQFVWTPDSTAILYVADETEVSQLYLADISRPLAAPRPLGSVLRIFDTLAAEFSPSRRYVVFPDNETPPQLRLLDLNTPSAPVVALGVVSSNPAWCWSPVDELLLVDREGRLVYVENFADPVLTVVSGPLVEGGRVLACAFPPGS